MKKIYHVILLCILASTLPLTGSAAFGWRWAKSIGGTGDDGVYRTVTDAAGNVYVAGVFYGPSLIFTPTNYVYCVNALAGEAYIAKYNSAGVFQWAKSGGGYSANKIYTMTLATDPSGNVYLGGTYQGYGIDFGGNPVFSHGSIGYYTYILKFDASGNIVLAKDYQNADITALAADAAGNMYMTGSFESSTLTLGSSTMTRAGIAGSDIFVSKLDAVGVPQWAVSFGGDTYDFSQSIALGNNNDVYIAGAYSSVSMNVGTTALTSAGGYDFLVAKLTTSGNITWAKSAGGYWDDYYNDMALDASNNVYLSGYFFSPTFNFGSGTITNTSTSGNKNMLVAKYNANGNELWAKNAGGTALTDNSYASAVAVDTANNVYVAGSFNSAAIDFDTIHITTLPNYIIKYNPSGNVMWGVAPGGDYLNDISTDKVGNVYAAGLYQFNLFFDTTKLTSTGDADIWLAKLGNPASTPPGNHVSELNYDNLGIALYPNPATNMVVITGRQRGETDVVIMDMTGKVVFSASRATLPLNVATNELPAGSYFVRVRTVYGIGTTKLTIEK